MNDAAECDAKVFPEYLSPPFGEDTFPDEISTSAFAERPVETQLTDGPGIFGYYSADKRYGTESTIAALVEVGRIWAARHSAPRIGVGDISLRGGGDIVGHRSHETGRDVDLRPIRNDGTEGPLTWRQARYSHSLTQELIDLLYSNGAVQVKVIGFNDPQSVGTVNWKNHDNHLHVRFYFGNEAAGFPVARLGMNHSPPVREVQRRMNNWKESNDDASFITIDGNFGELTLTAVEQFQSENGVEADGIFGENSWRKSLSHIV